jgi:hypothetical protein
MRRTLGPLQEMAESTGVVVRHLRKTGGQGLHAGLGSAQVGALVRSGLLVEHDPVTGRRTLVSTKCTLADRPPHSSLKIVGRSEEATIRWIQPPSPSADEKETDPGLPSEWYRAPRYHSSSPSQTCHSRSYKEPGLSPAVSR